ncbi:MAG TPA: hypothetical protein VFX16_36690 [Pseudonocardiaceae bacterium]|nr:hypothetical protein [Pseudonocardiaceae bacterium]
MTETGNRPAIGRRLCSLAIRLTVAVGIAGIAWLLGALLGAGTAAAAETPPPSTDTSAGLFGVVDNITGDLTNTVTDTVTDLTSTVTAVTTNTVTTVVAPSADDTPARPVVIPPVVAHMTTPVRTVVRHTVPVAKRAIVARNPVHRAKTVAPQRKSPHHVVSRRVARSVHHRPAPVPVPSRAPQAPSPSLPTGSVDTAHAGLPGLAVHAPGSAAPVLVSAGGRAADPATVDARSQCLPATSPD